MRDLVTLARRMLELRSTYRTLEREAARADAAGGALTTLETARLLMFKGAAQALAWALEVNLTLLDTPALTGLPGGPDVVTLYPVDLAARLGGEERRFYLMEVPAHDDPDDPEGFSTEAWSVTLSERQARELRAALARAFSAPLPVSSPVPLLTAVSDAESFTRMGGR